MNKFDSIRPYNDSEVRQVLKELVKNRELQDIFFKSSPIFSKFSYIPFKRPLLKIILNTKIKKINNIADYQKIFETLVDNVIKESIDEFKVLGIENLNKNDAYIFVSNHRDITLDSALLNYSLHRNNFKTTNNAVGNNLMEEKWASDLMRLNKSFIIDRAGKSKREIYKSLNLVSEFIFNQVTEHSESVWIAQKQGRAKDGIDITDPSVLKMIHLFSRKVMNIGDCLNKLKVVPVAISYEYDPNDLIKAREVFASINNTTYKKADGEDLKSISDGISKNKGDVLLNIGKQIRFDSESYEECADIITEKINELYKNHPTNHAAKNLLTNRNYSSQEHQEAIEYLNKQMSHIPDEMHDIYLKQYSNSL